MPFDVARDHLVELGRPCFLKGSPRTREIARLYYALEDGTPWIRVAIAEHLGMRKMRVQQILGQPTAPRLIGAESPVAWPRFELVGLGTNGVVRYMFSSGRSQQRADYAGAGVANR